MTERNAARTIIYVALVTTSFFASQIASAQHNSHRQAQTLVVSGSVVDSRGHAISGVEVRFSNSRGNLLETRRIRADGRFEMAVPHGASYLTIRHEKFSTFRTRLEVRNRNVRLGRVQLQPSSRTRTRSIRLPVQLLTLDGNRQPVGNTLVEFKELRNGTPVLRSVTDRMGRAEVFLPNGRYQAETWSRDGRRITRSFVVANRAARVVIPISQFVLRGPAMGRLNIVTTNYRQGGFAGDSINVTVRRVYTQDSRPVPLDARGLGSIELAPGNYVVLTTKYRRGTLAWQKFEIITVSKGQQALSRYDGVSGERL